jgi:hypothetical protein
MDIMNLMFLYACIMLAVFAFAMKGTLIVYMALSGLDKLKYGYIDLKENFYYAQRVFICFFVFYLMEAVVFFGNILFN